MDRYGAKLENKERLALNTESGYVGAQPAGSADTLICDMRTWDNNRALGDNGRDGRKEGDQMCRGSRTPVARTTSITGANV